MPCQQFELYTAEDAIDQGKRFDSLAEVQIFLDDMRDAYPFWERAYSHVERVEVGFADRRGTAHVGWFDRGASSGRVEFLTARPSMQLVLHELTHVLASARYGSRAHDPWFARSYLELTYLVRGSEVYTQLYRGYTEHGVDFDAEGLT